MVHRTVLESNEGGIFIGGFTSDVVTISNCVSLVCVLHFSDVEEIVYIKLSEWNVLYKLLA